MKFKKIAVKTVCVLAIISVLLSVIWDFSFQLKLVLTNETYRMLNSVSKDYNKAFIANIKQNIKTMNVIARNFGDIKNQSKQDVMYILQNAVDEVGFNRMVVCNADGISCSNDGISRDISQQNFFKKIIRGEYIVIEPLVSVVNGEESIIIAVPIVNEKIIGALFGVYPLCTAGSHLLDFEYYSAGYGFIISPDGKVLLTSEHTDKLADESNLYRFFEKTEFYNYSVDKLKAAIKDGESGSFSFMYNDARRFVSFTPSTVNDWYTFSIASDDPMMQQEQITNKIVIKLVLKLIVIGIILLIWLFVRNKHHNKELRLANQKYESLLSNINGGMIVAVHSKIAEDTIATYVSSGFTNMTGYTLEDIQNIYHGRYLDVVLDSDRNAVFEKYLEQLKIGNTYRMPYRIRKKDGSFIWVMDNGYLVESKHGLRNHSIITDITVIKKQEEELRLSENRFLIAINASSGALFEVDLKKKLYTHFENAERIFGVDEAKLLKDTAAFSALPFDKFMDTVTDYFFHPNDRAIAKSGMEKLLINRSISYEARLRRFDINSYIWCKIDLTMCFDEIGSPLLLVGFMTDIDDVKKQSELLEKKVQTDPMTGLYNKVAMAAISNKILSDNPHELHALIVLDIDNFKGINDTLGHAFGDVVLIKACNKLKTFFRSKDIVGRMGGDEFAILMKNVTDTSGVLKKATELSGSFRQTYAGEKEDYKISCSIGIIMIENNSESFETLYRKADAALYRAKQNGKDQFVLYSENDADNYPVETARTNDEELQNLKISHNIEAHIFELLYTSKDFNISINMALAAIGQQYHVSRVSIFENDDENLITNNIYEWCNEGITAEITNLQNLMISSGSESIFDCFDENGLLYCNDVRQLPPYSKHILDSKGVLSNLQVTIINDEKICGFIGFDECREYRVWTSEEVDKLLFLSKVLSVFLFKKKAEVSLLENLNTRLKILDVLPDYICVVNPETHSIVYSNSKMQVLFPSVRPGVFCFTKLRGGQAAPCETCLVKRIERVDTDSLEIISEDGRLHLKVNAIAINWTNDKKMVLLYGTLQNG